MDVINYINLASLAYINLPENKNDFTLGELVDDEIITADDVLKPELSAITDVNNQIRSWKLLAHQPNTPTGFAAAAFQSPEGQIIFAFRGAEPTLPSSPIKAIHAFLIKRLVSIHTLAV